MDRLWYWIYERTGGVPLYNGDDPLHFIIFLLTVWFIADAVVVWPLVTRREEESQAWREAAFHTINSLAMLLGLIYAVNRAPILAGAQIFGTEGLLPVAPELGFIVGNRVVALGTTGALILVIIFLAGLVVLLATSMNMWGDLLVTVVMTTALGLLLVSELPAVFNFVAKIITVQIPPIPPP